MDLLFSWVPWWGWLVVSGAAGLVALRFLGFNGLIAALVAGAAAAVYAKGRKTGVTVERERQHREDDIAREIIHETKEDVRAIPNTPAGEAERTERFNRWLK